jgi:N-acetylmuramoyl-L-alanine amidase
VTALRQFIGFAALFAVWVSPGMAQEAGRAPTAPKVTSVTVDQLGDTTLVEITSTRALDARVFTLADQKPRVVIDFPSVIWMLDGVRSERGERAGAGAVLKYRYAQNSPTRSRMVFEVSGPVSIKSETSTVGDRFSLKMAIGATDSSVFSKASGFPAAPPETVVAVAEPPKARRKVIILDPGHGGKDPGALAINGSQEKNVTLAAARQLAANLEATGRYKVVMTRSDDTFIPLERRVEIARAAKADLFLSLHADSGDNPEVRGASVYTLSEAGTERAKNIMTVQDWELEVKNTQKNREVADILVDLAQRDTKNQSTIFARKLVPQLQSAGASVLENTHRNAGFYVLLAPDVPAVLLEMGFLTNTDDAANLGSPKERARLTTAVASAIDDYFEPAVTTQSASR